MSFEEYLAEKKIESPVFKEAEPARWKEWRDLFEQMSPASFTAQKLYLINPIRRKYPIKIQPPREKEATAEVTQPPKSSKPMFKPKIN
jgi:hypothetical protein